jgi:hypothetical protein
VSTLLVTILFVGAGLLLAGGKVQLFLRGAQSLEWTECTGRVIESRVAGLGVRFREFEPRIVYTYQVHGRNYTNSTFALDWPLSVSRGKAWASEFAKQHPVGTQVVVCYDQDDPSRAVLRRGRMSVAQLVTWILASAVLAVLMPFYFWLVNASR